VDTAYGTGVDDAFDAGGAGGGEDVARSIYIRMIEFGWILRPKSIVGGNVVEDGAAGGGSGERVGVAEVSGDGFDVELGDAALRAEQGSNFLAAIKEFAGDVPAYEAGGSGDEDRLHASCNLTKVARAIKGK
jgi:hypothetical protein